MTTDTTILQIKSYLLALVPELSENTWNDFLQRVVVKGYKKGDFLYKPGTVCNYVTFINKGLIRSYYLLDGKEIITAFSWEDCYYSDYQSFLSRQGAKQYSEALEDTLVLNIHYDDLQEMYRKHHDCEKIGRMISENLFMVLSNRNSSFQFDTPDVRYEKFLKDCDAITQRIPQYMIASYIGVTPEALSRIRSRRATKKRS